MSTGSIIRTLRLENGLDLNFFDESRQIAADRWFVRVRVQMNISIEKKWFEHHPMDDLKFQHIRQALGDSALFEQKKERNFISADEKNDVINDICEKTIEMAKYYFTKNEFAAKFILKQYTEKMRHF